MAAFPVFASFWNNLVQRCAQVARLHDSVVGRCGSLLTACDHIGFRTISVPPVDINAFEKLFLKLGYRTEQYTVTDTQRIMVLRDSSNSSSANKLPTLYIEELNINTLDPVYRDLLETFVKHTIKEKPVDWDFFASGGNPWDRKQLCLSAYKELLKMSPYAASFFVTGFFPTHFCFLLNLDGSCDVQNHQEKHSAFNKEQTVGELLKPVASECLFQKPSDSRVYYGFKANVLTLDVDSEYALEIPTGYYSVSMACKKENDFKAPVTSKATPSCFFLPFTEADAQIVSSMSRRCLSPSLIAKS